MTSGLSFTKRLPRVLFFIDRTNPTDEQRESAKRFLPNVGFRNALHVADTPMAPLEECDYVAGEPIPRRYAETYPNVNEFDPARGDRLSDFYLPHGNVTDPNNEAARAAKPDANSFAGRNPSQGSPTMPGAITHPSGGVGAIGGYVAPQPQKPGAPFLGEGNADNPPPGGPGAAVNPLDVPPGGVTAQRTGQDVPRVSTGEPAPGVPGSGFVNPAAGNGGGFQGQAASDNFDKLSREELDKLAAERGLNPDDYPNKAAVISALRSAE